MGLTEDEAKTKWCFHVIASHTDPRAAPSQYERESGISSAFRHHCIGSACMAWRTQQAARETLRNYFGEPSVPVKFEAGQRVYPDGWQYSHTDHDRSGRRFDMLHRLGADDAVTGFCGLAGRPE